MIASSSQHFHVLMCNGSIGSGISFPIPWSQLPSNLYQAIRIVYRALNMRDIKEKRNYFEEHGLSNSFDILKLHREDSPIITSSMEGASVPLDIIPKNVSAVGPIIMPVTPVAEQDAKLHAWLEQAPTILINLGSSIDYSRERATVMAAAIKQVLNHKKVQVLWKIKKGDEYSDDCLALLQGDIADGRVKVETWLSVDPTAILEAGHIIAMVHHGGANSYHESV